MPIFLLWSCTEFTRIALGYVGNVSERVPMMSAFLLLTIFPQFVAVFFLTARQDPVEPESQCGAFCVFEGFMEHIRR